MITSICGSSNAAHRKISLQKNLHDGRLSALNLIDRWKWPCAVRDSIVTECNEANVPSAEWITRIPWHWAIRTSRPLIGTGANSIWNCFKVGFYLVSLLMEWCVTCMINLPQTGLEWLIRELEQFKCNYKTFTNTHTHTQGQLGTGVKYREIHFFSETIIS